MKNLNDIEKQIKWNEYYKQDFDWNIFTTYKNKVYSDEFIEEFQDKVDWYNIDMYQKVSDSFLNKF